VVNLPTGPRPNQVTEAGGQWVASYQKRILALCKTLGIRKFPTYDKGKWTYYDGQPHTYTPESIDDFLPPVPADQLAQAVDAVAKLELMCQTFDVDHPERAPDAEAWDSMTLSTWLDGLELGPVARKLLEAAAGGPVGGTSDNTSLLGYLFVAKANGGPVRLVSVKGGELAFRLDGGSALIARRLVQRIGEQRVKLNSPVTQIERTGSGVWVIAGTAVWSAQHVIVAVPPPWPRGSATTRRCRRRATSTPNT